MRSLITKLGLAFTLALGSFTLAQPASAEGIEVLDTCPELTDSVTRLYSAYFLRSPDNTGIDFWIGEYSEGRWSLPRISQHFSESDEFAALYGSLSNRQFVDLIYQNILGRPGEATGVDFWTGRLDRRELTRGQVMLSFSEGPEYVQLTGTAPPMAGYYQSYPEGARWFCGTQNREIAFSPGGPFYADGLAEFTSDVDLPTENFIVRTKGPRDENNSLVVNEIINDGETAFFWNGRYDTIASWQDTRVLEVTAIDVDKRGFRWAVVVYPSSIGSARGGLGDGTVIEHLGGSLLTCFGSVEACR